MGIKSFLYAALKYSNDINAINQALKKDSMKPIQKRVARRIVGKITGRAMGKWLR